MAASMSDGMAGGCAGGGPPDVDCDEAVRQLYRYLDGDLTEDRRRDIAFHLDECGWCSDAAGFEAELRAVIANKCRDRVPESLKSRVAAAIHEEALRRQPPTGTDA
ncbi:MAG: mycothiol system anti-sigma-R factor [Acidimicrobiales bacterium]